MTSIWAVVPSCNRADSALRSISALLRQTEPLGGIVMVDNGSPDGIGEQARARFGDAVTVVRSEDNLGAAGGFAAGISKAMKSGAAWVWLMDDDACPVPSALRQLTESSQFADAGTVALSALKQNPDGTPQ